MGRNYTPLTNSRAHKRGIRFKLSDLILILIYDKYAFLKISLIVILVPVGLTATYKRF